MDTASRYEIRIEGHLTACWSDWLDGLTLHHDPGGVTILRGSLVDQAALLGLLTRLHALNLTLLSVNRLPEPGDG